MHRDVNHAAHRRERPVLECVAGQFVNQQRQPDHGFATDHALRASDLDRLPIILPWKRLLIGRKQNSQQLLHRGGLAGCRHTAEADDGVDDFLGPGKRPEPRAGSVGKILCLGFGAGRQRQQSPDNRKDILHAMHHFAGDQLRFLEPAFERIDIGKAADPAAKRPIAGQIRRGAALGPTKIAVVAANPVFGFKRAASGTAQLPLFQRSSSVFRM